MVETAVAFKKFLDKNDKKYEYDEREGAADVVTLKFSGQNFQYITIRFFFDPDCCSVAVRCFSICQFDEKTLAAGVYESNKLNNEYRWLKFSIDDDNEATAAIDAVITPENSGEVCYELLARSVNIIDDVYPRLMKARWGN